MKRPRFEVIKMRVRRDILHGSSRNVANFLSRKLKKNQRLVYLKHNTLVGSFAYWTAIVENMPVIPIICVADNYRPMSPVWSASSAESTVKKKSGRRAS